MSFDGIDQELERMARCAREGLPYSSPIAPMMSTLDADDVATWLATFLVQAGRKVRFNAVSTKPGTLPHHVFVEVWYPPGNIWLSLDALYCHRRDIPPFTSERTKEV